MAVDQSSNFRQLNLNRFPSPLDSDDQATDSNSGSVSGRKIKFLCSFGGKILPRPGDGALRYVGGHTRIISLRKDVSFAELMAKMADTFGGSTILKYQLPDEDLDALVSVSCPEDLENMMEEYDKLAESSHDGSAKLRVFLFPPSDLEGLVDGHDDTGQRYLEAINATEFTAAPMLRRKDSGASATSSTQNSESAATADIAADVGSTGLPEGSSPRAPFVQGIPPPTTSFIDSTSASVAPPLLNSGYVTLGPGQTYIDPNQVQFVTPSGTYISYVSPIPVHVNTALPAAPAAVSTGIKPIQTRPETFMEEIPYATRVVPNPSDQTYKAYQHQPLSQLPPLVPTYIPSQVPPQVSQGQSQLKLEECQMCQKALPHSHSDMLAQEINSKGSASSASEVSPVFYSQNHHRVAIGEDIGTESKADNTISVNQLADYGLVNVDSQHVIHKTEAFDLATSLHPSVAMGFSDNRSVPKTENINVVHPSASMMGLTGMLSHPKAENYNHAANVNPPALMGFPGDLSGNYGLVPPGNPLHPFINEPLHQQQLCQTVGLAHNLVQPDVTDKPQIAVADNSAVTNAKFQAVEPAMFEAVPAFSYETVRPLDTMMQSLQVSPTEASRFDEQLKPIANPNFAANKEFLPDDTKLVVENGHVSVKQLGGNVPYAANSYVHSGVASDVNQGRPINKVAPTAMDVNSLQNLQHVNTTQFPTTMLNHRVYDNNLDLKPDPLVRHDWLVPQHSHGLDVPYSHDALNKVPMDDMKAEVPLTYSKDVPNPITPPISSYLPTPSSNISSHNENAELLQEHQPSDSLFSNSDPWNIVGVTNVLPPKPIRVASRESIASKESAGENYSVNSNSNISTMLQEGEFHQPLSFQSKSIVDPVQITKGSAEEQVKKDLQAVAEGVASSALRPSTPPVPVFFARERKEITQEANKDREIIEENVNSQSAAAIVDRKVEDIKSRHLDKIHLGLPRKEDIGRLQIIKNSDLEELRELGSGTFGTVYHGKWRGSDVAIKRINDRCFAGKPSEQDRMRSDFWNEASKLADLHHPNVVAFYGVVLDGPGGSVATVTEYMVNGSLRSALQRNEKALDRRKRLLIAMDVAFGMEYLHGKNIVHFDVKSDNLLVNLRDPQRPICKVGDLGLSKVKCQTLISGGVRGTLPWMAPELLSGSSNLVSEKVDVFSFGIVMWELLTGEEPYADLHYGAIIGGIVNNTLRPTVPESCDPEWRELMEQCWSTEPSERPSFTEIVNRLRSMAASLPQKNTGNHAAHQHPQK